MNGASVDQIYQAFANHGPAIQGALTTIALDVFGALFLIELVWSIGWAIAHKTDIQDIIALVTRHMIVGGFFLFLLQNWAQFSKAITDSFALAGGAAATAMGGTATMMPLGLLDAGVNIAKHIWQGMSFSSPALSILLTLNGIIDVVIFAYFAALLIEILIECFFAAYVGIIMMGFGGNAYTRDMAISQMRYAISVGVKRLTMQLIAGVAEAIVNGWSTTIQNNPASMTWADCGLMIAVPIILVRLAQTMPKIAQDVVNGSHLSAHGSLFTATAQLAKAATTLAAAVTGAGAAITAGAALASKQMGNAIADGSAPSTRVGQAAQMSRMAITETGKAMVSDVGKRLTGNYRGTHGYSGWRIAADLSQKANDL